MENPCIPLGGYSASAVGGLVPGAQHFIGTQGNCLWASPTWRLHFQRFCSRCSWWYACALSCAGCKNCRQEVQTFRERISVWAATHRKGPTCCIIKGHCAKHKKTNDFWPVNFHPCEQGSSTLMLFFFCLSKVHSSFSTYIVFHFLASLLIVRRYFG